MPTAITFGAIAARAFGFLGSVLRKDPYFPYVTMLLPGNGTNGAQNNTFLDSSTNNFTITRNGNTTQGTFTPYGSNWGNYFPSTAATCLKYGTSTNLALGSGDFTVEFWTFINALAPSYTTLVDWRTNGNAGNTIPIITDFNNNGNLCFVVGTGAAFTTIVQSSTTIPLRSWTHIAIVRNGTTVTMYFNGVSVGSGTSSVNFGIETFSVNNPQASNYNADCYISNFRIVKGTAVYTSAFTPPTAPLTAITNTSLLTCQSNRFIDNSSNAFAITVNGSPSVQRFSPFSPSASYSTSVVGGSGYLSISTDSLTTPFNTAFAFPGAYTVEVWYYPTVSLGANQYTLITQESSGGFVVFLEGAVKMGSRAVAVELTGSANPTQGIWNHIVVVRNSSNSTSIFLNGTRIANATIATSYSSASGNFIVGGNAFGSGAAPGYYSSVRVVKGTAVYDPTQTTITVPTSPLTAITNTSLLLNMTNGGIIDNAMMNDLETVGNAQISTAQSKFGTGSIYFDGTGDWLSTPSSPNLAFGTGPYTIEFWLYSTTSSGERGVLQTQTASLYGVSVFLDGTTIYIDERTNTYSGSDPRISGSITQNAWVHVAICRQTGTSGTLRAFVNGTQIGSSVTSNLRDLTSTGPVFVGTTAVAANPLNGYIDDLRITKGIARYTANFTPPTAAFPTQ